MAPKPDAAFAQEVLPLNAVWYNVLKPGLLQAGGQPAYQLIGQYETIYEASGVSNGLPGSMVVTCVVVHVTPKSAPPAGLVRN